MTKAKERKKHSKVKYDPLAKASKKCDYDMSYLDFTKIPDDSGLKNQITEYTWMGSVGEAYSPLYLILPATYREWSSPSESYDAMIYVTNAHPTEVKNSK